MSQLTDATASPARSVAPKRSGARTKGIVAIVAGTALLLGGAGTYALWTTDESLQSGTVQSGDLDLALGTGTWTLQGVLDTTPATVADPAAVRIVPGDVLTLTQPIDVTLVGDTIEADLSVLADDIVPDALEQYMTVSFATTGTGTETAPNTYRVTPETADAVTSATVTITFSASTPERVATNTDIDLNDVTFSLTQASN